MASQSSVQTQQQQQQQQHVRSFQLYLKKMIFQSNASIEEFKRTVIPVQDGIGPISYRYLISDPQFNSTRLMYFKNRIRKIFVLVVKGYYRPDKVRFGRSDIAEILYYIDHQIHRLVSERERYGLKKFMDDLNLVYKFKKIEAEEKKEDKKNIKDDDDDNDEETSSRFPLCCRYRGSALANAPLYCDSCNADLYSVPFVKDIRPGTKYLNYSKEDIIRELHYIGNNVKFAKVVQSRMEWQALYQRLSFKLVCPKFIVWHDNQYC